VLNDERGSLRSRGASAVSSLTLRQISAVLPADQAWGLWLSRQIVARVMDTFGPSLAGFIAHALRDTRIDKAAG
jgi:monoterpene epsilon-lactone hydrolase